MSNKDTLSNIKKLRELTGVGFKDCKIALDESNGDLDKSIEFLRKKGIAKASKKMSRTASEGLVLVKEIKGEISTIEINSETDFAAKSDTFLDFLDKLGSIVLENNSKINKDDLLSLSYENGTIKDYFDSMIAKIGENLILNDLLVKENKNTYYAYYIHNSYRSNIGKIISLLEYTCASKNEEIESLSKNLCMHIAAMKPESIDINDLDKNIVEKEEKIQKELILNSGKPSNIIDKILEGKMKKFYSEVTLLNQTYILDQDKSVRVVLDEYSKYEFKLKSFELISL